MRRGQVSGRETIISDLGGKNAKSSGYLKLCKFGQLMAGNLLRYPTVLYRESGIKNKDGEEEFVGGKKAKQKNHDCLRETAAS